MKQFVVRLLPLFAAVTFLVQMAGCATIPQGIDALAILQSLLKQVTYDTLLSKVGSAASLYFPDLPEGTDIQLYTGCGYYADEVALLTLPDPECSDSALQTVKRHIAELRKQFVNYIPEEVRKIDNAVIYQNEQYIFLCITNDHKSAERILANAQDPSHKITTNSDQTASDPTINSEPDPTGSEEPAESECPVDTYPVLKSKSGTYCNYENGVIRVDNCAFEEYTYVESSAKQYATVVSSVADKLAGITTVYCLAIPTGIGIVLPDDIAAILPGYENQGQAIDKIFKKMSSNVVTVDCYDNLMKHRDEYLYFRTDHHWNGVGAYYAYEAFCREKGVQAYTLGERTEKRFDNFIGTFYMHNSGKDPLLADMPDTVIAYCPVSAGATMSYTDRNGNTYDWNIVMDVSNWDDSSKYSAFAAGDNPIAVFTNPEVTDGSVCVIVKESYGNALLPYLVDHYSTIYEIDYRYWKGDLVDFAGEVGANDLLFANSLSMIRSNYLISLLKGIITPQ